MRDVQPAQQCDERKRLRHGLQFAAVTRDVFLPEQPFDDRRAGGGCAETFVRHRLAQFFVVDQFARAFHRSEQRRFGIARRRFGDVRFDFDLLRLDRLTGFHRGKRRRVVGLCGFLAIDGEPARVDHDFTFALERLVLDAGDARSHEEFCRRIKDREEPFRDEIVKLLFRLAQRLGRNERGNDGEMVRYFCIVKDAFVRADPAVLQNIFRMRAVTTTRQHGHRLLDRLDVILR